jgi:microcystin-dependent protein
MIRTVLLALAGLLCATAETMAQPCPTSGLTTLSAGNTADASQVMNNFTYVANCVNNLAATGVPSGTVVAYSGVTLPSGWLWANGAIVSRTTYSALLAALTRSATVTITIASPGVVTWTAHGLSNGWPVLFSTTGTLPTGITAGTIYYVVSATTNSFRVASAPGGTAINTSGSQSGTQTAIFAPYGNGDGATTFGLPDLRGRAPFGLDNMGGAAAGNLPVNGTYIKGTSPGASGGEYQHTLTIGEIPSHSHQIGVGGIPANGVNVRATSGDGTNAGFFPSEGAGGNGAHNVLPPALMTNYIIKQ